MGSCLSSSEVEPKETPPPVDPEPEPAPPPPLTAPDLYQIPTYTNAGILKTSGREMGPAPSDTERALRLLRTKCLEFGGGTMGWKDAPEDVREWFRTKWSAEGQLAELELFSVGAGLQDNIGWHAECARALASFGELRTLLLGGNQMKERCLACYIPALASCPKLEHLSLYGNQLGFECIGALVAALPPTLKHLDLSCNLLGAAGMEALAGSDGGNIAHLTNLQTLKLGTNGWDPSLDESRIFRSKGCLALVPALSRLPALTELLLENNFVEAEGVEAVRRALEGRSVQVNC